MPEEIAALDAVGVRIFSPADGQRLGLPGMINELIRTCDVDLAGGDVDVTALRTGDVTALARAVTVLESGRRPELAAELRTAATQHSAPVLGITGTGGSGKSSLTDELVRRLRRDSQDKLRVAVLAVDPTRRRGGGALLGDRIRMNSIDPDVVFFRSFATRDANTVVPPSLDDAVAACRAAGYDLVIVETPGIGQGDVAISSHADVSLYVMTPEYGAASQLEKIDMLDFADVVAVNKFERRGAEDARRDVARQMVRNREAFGTPWEEMPVFGTSAARFDDDGVTALYQELKSLLTAKGLREFDGTLAPVDHALLHAHRARAPPRPRALPRRDRRHRAHPPRRDRAPRGARPSGAAALRHARAARGRGRDHRRRGCAAACSTACTTSMPASVARRCSTAGRP